MDTIGTSLISDFLRQQITSRAFEMFTAVTVTPLFKHSYTNPKLNFISQSMFTCSRNAAQCVTTTESQGLWRFNSRTAYNSGGVFSYSSI